jgi:hypothetical protein
MPRRQHGLSAMGFVFVLLVLAFAITVSLKLAPHYIDFYTMKSVLDGLSADDVRSNSKLADTLKKRFKINNLRGFEISDIITVDRSREGTALLLNYERREHLFYNVDVVITFNKRYEYL